MHPRLAFYIRITLIIGLSSGLLFVILYLIASASIKTDARGLLLLGLISLVLVSTYVLLRNSIDYFFHKLLPVESLDTTKAIQEYSQAVNSALELDQLIVAVQTSLMQTMRVKSGLFCLVNNTRDDQLELIVKMGQQHPDTVGKIKMSGPIYQRLATEQKPIFQAEIEQLAKSQKVTSSEADFFRSLRLIVYAPIVIENAMIGLLGCGEKHDQSSLTADELKLLMALAHQTGVALRNSRLVDDLQHLNKNMRSLNKTLKRTNEQLARMDAVKSDFVTIASHELRTPLAQIRGYTDMLDALNDQGMLDPEQTTSVVGNLRKATERTEELIAAMLDVSKLDVNAMDLRFIPTSVEIVIKMAIEPLTESIRQRRIALTARGLKGLPSIEADLKRLVQAFSNLVVNAVKFTPDGGIIEIQGELQSASNGQQSDFILITIKDTGVGIDPKNLEMVFKKFFRAYDPSLHSTGATKFMGAGPGLGLTIARGVIEGHGGKIWAESTEHNIETFPGTTFYVLLPVSTPESVKGVLTFEGEAAADAIQ